MARPKFVQARKTTLSVGISATEATEIKLKDLVDSYGNELAFTDFGDAMYLTFAPGTLNEEIVKATGFTVNTDGTVSIDTGITRGLASVSAYGAGSINRAHAAGTVVVVTNTPQFYDALVTYLEGIANAGAADASTTSAGIVEEATVAEIDADTGTGATSRRLFVSPEYLASSKYGTRLPDATGAAFVSAVTGMIIDYAGNTAPTGFLLCDGTAYNNDDYENLLTVLQGRFGLTSAATFTADNATDTYTATDHGLSDGDIILVASSASDLPNGLNENTLYYVISSTTNTFQLSTTSAGSAVSISDDGTGTHSFYTQFYVPDLRGSTAIGKGQKVVTFDFSDSDVNTGTDVITVDENSYLYTGQAVALTTSGTLPTGLSATTYYIIRASSTTVKLATSVANANAGTAVDITAAAGGGTHTLTLTMTDRSVGDSGGEETHALSDAEMPSHTHSNAPGSGTASGGGSSAYNNAGTTGATGSDTPHNNMPPFVAVNKIIKT